MRSFNTVMLIGRLTSDPQVHESKKEGGKSVTTFSIALNRNWKNKEGVLVEATDFQKIVSFGKLGNVVAKYLKKGRAVLVSGKLRSNSYTAQDGSRRYITEVVMEDFNFLDSLAKSGAAVENDEEVEVGEEVEDKVTA